MATNRPVNGYDARALLDAQTAEERTAIARQMGVANIDPPLPHSPCLKNIKTGVVLPWNELLAAQRDLVVCCDTDGNTDEAVWGPKVIQDAPSNEILAMMAQQQIFKKENPYELPMTQAKQVVGPTDYERLGVMPYSEIDKLQEKLDASKPAHTGSVEGS